MALGITDNNAGRWRARFAEKHLAGIEKEAPGRGRKPTRRHELAERIIAMTTQQKPTAATHWSTRTLSQVLKCSRSMVHRVWQSAGLKPHLVRGFKVSNDPHFVEKLRDIVGLYLNPPEHALVLCADEKSQIQALDRTQKSLPIYPGRCGTLTHDYKRNGTTSLFAAIDMLEGKVIGQCMPRHRHQEWLKFLNLIDSGVPQDLAVHLIVDNYSTHKHTSVQRWLKHHPRFHFHFTPTSSSWLNMIERWFRDITDKRIRRGVFKSVPQLVDAITDYIANHNTNPKPFVWTAKAEDILEKVRRARATLDNPQSF
jgi:transposase